MKANELMIGDWYDWYADGKNYHYQVTKETFSNDDATIANFEPISLTPEILEKNGFVFNMIYKTYEFHRYGIHIELAREGKIMIGLSISVTDNEGFGCNADIDKGKIIYVHELQHALRLCGLNDLADNFKIE